MVTRKQRREIKKRMLRVKKAKDNNADNRIIKKRTQELYNYLEREGIVMR